MQGTLDNNPIQADWASSLQAFKPYVFFCHIFEIFIKIPLNEIM